MYVKRLGLGKKKYLKSKRDFCSLWECCNDFVFRAQHRMMLTLLQICPNKRENF